MRQDKSFEKNLNIEEDHIINSGNGVAKTVSVNIKRTKDTKRMYPQKFPKEETKSRKDKRSH